MLVDGRNKNWNKGYYKSIPMPSSRECAKTLTCERCGSEFTVRMARGRKVCYECEKELSAPKECAYCGSMFGRRMNESLREYGNRKCCCPSCSQRLWRERKARMG